MGPIKWGLRQQELDTRLARIDERISIMPRRILTPEGLQRPCLLAVWGRYDKYFDAQGDRNLSCTVGLFSFMGINNQGMDCFLPESQSIVDCYLIALRKFQHRRIVNRAPAPPRHW